MSPCVWSQNFRSIVRITGFRIRFSYIGFHVEISILLRGGSTFDPQKFVEEVVFAWRLMLKNLLDSFDLVCSIFKKILLLYVT